MHSEECVLKIFSKLNKHKHSQVKIFYNQIECVIRNELTKAFNKFLPYILSETRSRTAELEVLGTRSHISSTQERDGIQVKELVMHVNCSILLHSRALLRVKEYQHGTQNTQKHYNSVNEETTQGPVMLRELKMVALML